MLVAARSVGSWSGYIGSPRLCEELRINSHRQQRDPRFMLPLPYALPDLCADRMVKVWPKILNHSVAVFEDTKAVPSEKSVPWWSEAWTVQR